MGTPFFALFNSINKGLKRRAPLGVRELWLVVDICPKSLKEKSGIWPCAPNSKVNQTGQHWSSICTFTSSRPKLLIIWSLLKRDLAQDGVGAG